MQPVFHFGLTIKPRVDSTGVQRHDLVRLVLPLVTFIDLRHGERSCAPLFYKIMTNRTLSYLVKDQNPLIAVQDTTVRDACRSMCERCVGATLVVDRAGDLTGIFTGRDAVHLLAERANAGSRPLADAMTRDPTTVSPKARALDALKAMCEGGFRHVPVTENGKIVGIVSRGDFKGMELEEYCWRILGQRSGSPGNRRIEEIIAKRSPLVLSSNDTVARACEFMWSNEVGCVLVGDQHQQLTGIFTGRDAVRALARIDDAAAVCLAEAMTRNPTATTPDRHAIDALHVMNEGGFRHLPVVKDGTTVGVVSRSDFTGVEIDQLDEEEHLKECIW